MGVIEELKDLFKAETGATVTGVVGGILGGEYLGETTKTALGLTEWTGVGSEAAVKVGGATGVFLLNKYGKVTGVPRYLLNGISIGMLASALSDVIDELIGASRAVDRVAQYGQRSGEVIRQSVTRISPSQAGKVGNPAIPPAEIPKMPKKVLPIEFRGGR